MEATRSMLHDQDLPMHIWAEAARTTVYVQKHTPHGVLENNKTEEVFFGKKPEVSHLGIFGCPVYIHIPKEKRTKLDPSRFQSIPQIYPSFLKDLTSSSFILECVCIEDSRIF